MKLADMKVGMRLGAGFSLVLVLVAAMAAVGSWRLHGISASVSHMVGDTMVQERLFSEWSASTHINGARTIAVAEADASQAARVAQTKAAIKATSARISEIQKKLDGLPKSPEEERMFAEIGARRAVYVAARDAVFKEKETSQEAAAGLISSRLEPALNDYVASINKLAAYQNAAIDASAAATTALAAQSKLQLITLGLIALLMGVAVAVVITRSLKSQLGGEPAYASDIAGRIASGDLTTAIETRAGDNASLLYAMKTMQANLAGLVSQVRSGTDAITTASCEIAAGNQDLSSRTEEQASSLEETASSMEELTSTVRQNAENARQANQMAVSAAGIAVKGGEVVSQVVATMGAIDGSARKIVDIISVIDGIAFQTNILALNAAVEAARAGEQGRGFAVVASEVRALAQRSAAAAKEIKSLIDASVQDVDTGSRLVTQAGATMEELVHSVQRVTDIMAEIMTASDEQSEGIEQVNQAIGQMDTVTQQNAALVEQAAAAAESMQDQAGKLSQVVSVFRVSGEPVALAPVRAVRASPAPKAVAGSVQRSQRPRRAAPAAPARSSAPQPVAAGATDWEEF